MNIPKFWARAEKTTDKAILQKWHWSDSSEADAKSKALERIEAMLARMHAGEPWPIRDYYGTDMPLREELISELEIPGEGAAVITRNTYGALILNVDNVMFVDIDSVHDDPVQSATLVGSGLRQVFGFLRNSIFGTSTKPATTLQVPAKNASTPTNDVSHVESWVAQHPGWVFRAYQTKFGFRLIAMHGLFQPESNETKTVLEALNCDPVYMRLCRNQKNFRARLTPKPWRLSWGSTSPPARFPYTEKSRIGVNRWIDKYNKLSQNYATCQYLKTVGIGPTDSTAQIIADVHDQWTKATSGLPLA